MNTNKPEKSLEEQKLEEKGQHSIKLSALREEIAKTGRQGPIALPQDSLRNEEPRQKAELSEEALFTQRVARKARALQNNSLKQGRTAGLQSKEPQAYTVQAKQAQEEQAAPQNLPKNLAENLPENLQEAKKAEKSKEKASQKKQNPRAELPKKTGLLIRFFDALSRVPSLTIFFFCFLAFGINALRPDVWLAAHQDLVLLIQEHLAVMPQMGQNVFANIGDTVLYMLQFQTDSLLSGANTALTNNIWPLPSLLMQSLVLYSPLPIELGLCLLFFVLSLALFFTVYALARSCGLPQKDSLASVCLVLLSPLTFYLYSFSFEHVLLALSLLLASLFFYQAWIRPFAPLRFFFAFFFALCLGLCGGPLWLLVPMLTSLLFLLWIFAFRRAGGLDAVIMFALFLLAWGGIISVYAMLPEGRALLQIFLEATKKSFSLTVNTTFISDFFLFSLPWIFILFFRLHALKDFPKAFVEARRNQPNTAWLWLFFLISFALSCLLQADISQTFLVLWPLTAILLARGFLKMSPKALRYIFVLIHVYLGSWALYLFSLGLRGTVPPDTIAFVYDVAYGFFSQFEQFFTSAFSDSYEQAFFWLSSLPKPSAPLFFALDELSARNLMSLGTLGLLFVYLVARHVDKRQAQGALLALSVGFCLWISAAVYFLPKGEWGSLESILQHEFFLKEENLSLEADVLPVENEVLPQEGEASQKDTETLPEKLPEAELSPTENTALPSEGAQAL